MFRDWDQIGHNWVTPGQRGEHLRLSDFPAMHLIGLAGLMKQSMLRSHLEPWGLSMSEWRVLSLVAAHSPVPFARIAQLADLDKAQVSRALRVAQGKGHVETAAVATGQRPGVRRAEVPRSRVMVAITAAGREIHDKIMPLVQRDQLRLLQMLSPEERRMLLRLVQRLDAQLRAELGRASQWLSHGEQAEPGAHALRVAQQG